MHALNRTDRTTPVIAGNYLQRSAGDHLVGRAVLPCILLAMPNRALSLMTDVPEAEQLTGNQPRLNASGRDHSGIWLRNAAIGLCLLAAAAAVVEFHRAVPAGLRDPASGGGGRAGGRDPRCRRAGVRLPGDRAGPARSAGGPGPDPEWPRSAPACSNTIAAAPDWRNLAVWAMPPVAYALASDTLIGVSLGLVILKVSCFCWSDGIWWL